MNTTTLNQSYGTPPPSSRYAHYVYNSTPRRNSRDSNRRYRFGDNGGIPFIRLGGDNNNHGSATGGRAIIKEAKLGQQQLCYVSIAPICLGIAAGLAIGMLGLIGCYNDSSRNKFANIDFPDICIQAEETLFVKNYDTWNLAYNIFSMFQVGAIFGSILTLCLSNVIGPKALCQLSSFALFLGSIMGCIAKEEMFILSIISKLASSVGIGISMICVPQYVVETSTVKTRTAIGGLFQFCLFTGISISLYLKYHLFYNDISQLHDDSSIDSKNENNIVSRMSLDWLIALGLQSIPSILSLLFLCLVPESPRWLMKKGRFGEAGDALRLLRLRAEVVEAEITLMQDVIDNGNNEVIEEDHNFRTNMYRYFCVDFTKKNLRVLFITIMHCIIGIGIIAKFIPYILTKTIYPKSFMGVVSPTHAGSHNNTNNNGKYNNGNVEKKMPIFFLYLLVLANASMFVSICTTSRFKNRRRLLIFGSCGLSISGCLLCVLELGFISKAQSVTLPVYLSAAVLYVVSYSMTWGHIGWSLPLEYFDLLNRGFGFAISWVISWIISFGVSMATTYFEFRFKKLSNSFDAGTLAILLLYTAVNVAGTAIILIFYKEIPEGKVLEEIEEEYYNGLNEELQGPSYLPGYKD